MYVRDEALWMRARAAGGAGGLSELVQESLRDWLDRHRGRAPEPSLRERARRLLAEAEALVAAAERAAEPPRPRRRRRAGAPRR